MADVIEYDGSKWSVIDEWLCGRWKHGEPKIKSVVMREVPDEPDEVEALAQEMRDVWWGDSTPVPEDWDKATRLYPVEAGKYRRQARYVLANYVKKAEAKRDCDTSFDRGVGEGKHVADQAAYARCENCSHKAAHVKPRIAPEDLDRLAYGLFLESGGAAGTTEPVPWDSPHMNREYWRKHTLAKLNAEVAEPQVDFVVSGPNGATLTPKTEEARSRTETLQDWPTHSCSTRRVVLAALYDANTILLDKNGGGK